MDPLPRATLHRIAEPEEVSNLVLFLACDEPSYITGAEHVIDAGMTAHYLFGSINIDLIDVWIALTSA